MPAYTDCPGCRAVAQIVDHYVLDSTDGPVEHDEVRCLACRATYTRIT